MKTHAFRSSVILIVGVLLTLTSCEYPSYYNGRYYNSGYGYNQRAGTLYGAAGGAVLGSLVSRRHPLQGALIGGVLGGLAGNAIGANRDRYYYSNSYYGSRGYQPYYSNSYYNHPYYSNSSYSSPYYSRNFNGCNNRPWGSSYGFGMPYGWGSGFGLGSRWY